MTLIAYIHTLYVTGVRKVLEYEGKTENIFEKIFCIETVWAPKIFDMLHYFKQISCQFQLKQGEF